MEPLSCDQLKHPINRSYLKIALLLLVDSCQLLVYSYSHRLPPSGITRGFLVRLCMAAAVLICLFYCAKKRYLTTAFGILITLCRMLLASGLGMSLHPEDLNGWYGLVYQHRCLVASVVAAALGTPPGWYWTGSVLSVICALVYDLALLPPSCFAKQMAAATAAAGGASSAAAMAALAALFLPQLSAAAAPTLGALPLMRVITHSTGAVSRVASLGAEVLLPGLVLHVLQPRADKERRRQQQLTTSAQMAAKSAAPPPPAAASAAVATAATCGGGGGGSKAPQTCKVKPMPASPAAAAAARFRPFAEDGLKACMADQAAEQVGAAGSVTPDSSTGSAAAAAAATSTAGSSPPLLGEEQTLSDSASSYKAVLDQLKRVGPKVLAECMARERSFSGEETLEQLPSASGGPPSTEPSTGPQAQLPQIGLPAWGAAEAAVEAAAAAAGACAAQVPAAPAAAALGGGTRQAGTASSGSSVAQNQGSAASAFKYGSPLRCRTVVISLEERPGSGGVDIRDVEQLVQGALTRAMSSVAATSGQTPSMVVLGSMIIPPYQQ